jgi:hypothetical protein
MLLDLPAQSLGQLVSAAEDLESPALDEAAEACQLPWVPAEDPNHDLEVFVFGECLASLYYGQR